MFDSIAQLVTLATNSGQPLHEIVIQAEMANTGKPREYLLGRMGKRLEIMQRAAALVIDRDLIGAFCERLDRRMKFSLSMTDGTVYLDERNINLAMVAAGHAWWYRYYARNDHLLEAAEGKARAANLGLWGEPDPIPPWDWRRQQKYAKP